MKTEQPVEVSAVTSPAPQSGELSIASESNSMIADVSPPTESPVEDQAGAAGAIESKTTREAGPQSGHQHGGKSGGHGSATALQDMFLNGLRRENIDAVVYFCDGSQERGAVRAFDTFTILLENRSSGKLQLVYKHSIARIFPTRCPQLSLPGRNRGKG